MRRGSRAPPPCTPAGKTPEEIRKTFNIKNDFTPVRQPRGASRPTAVYARAPVHAPRRCGRLTRPRRRAAPAAQEEEEEVRRENQWAFE